MKGFTTFIKSFEVNYSNKRQGCHYIEETYEKSTKKILDHP